MSGLAYQKSRRLAIRIVRLYAFLKQEKHEFVMSKQRLRCGTSIGANLAEAECAISRADFLAKTYIALKEVMENAMIKRNENDEEWLRYGDTSVDVLKANQQFPDSFVGM